MSFGLALLVVIGGMLAIALYLWVALGLASKAWDHFGGIGFIATMSIMTFLPFVVTLAWAITSGS